MTVCLVTDRRQLAPDARTARAAALALTRWLEDAVPAGVDLIQIRERDLPGGLLCDVVRSVTAMTAGTSTAVVVNDRGDVAVAAGAHGVHLRGDGPPADRVRALFGVSAPGTRLRQGYGEAGSAPGPSTWVIGRSVHSGAEARQQTGANYVVFGAVFSSGEKPGRGLAALRDVVSATPAPVLAIGGMTVDRAAECLGAGAAGVAAIGLFLPPGRAGGAMGLAAATAALRAIGPVGNRVS